MKFLRSIVPSLDLENDPNQYVMEGLEDWDDADLEGFIAENFDSWELTHEEPSKAPKKSFKARMAIATEKAAKKAAADKVEKAKAGKQWHVDNPVSHHNIVNHYLSATPEERAQGHHWYEDAHHMTKHIANDTNTPMHTMAGLIANYSPQTHWASNIMTASRVARTKTGVGGPGSYAMATKQQKHSAERMLSGEHYNDVMKGQKIKAFAHLIEHGGDSHHVVVDRHALSVATGKRVPDSAFGYAGLKGKKKYEQVSHAYRQATDEINKRTGQKLQPHQVQATTWLVRQRMNNKHDNEMYKTQGAGKTAKHAQHYIQQWNKYRSSHHPNMTGRMPGTGYEGEKSLHLHHDEDSAPF